MNFRASKGNYCFFEKSLKTFLIFVHGATPHGTSSKGKCAIWGMLLKTNVVATSNGTVGILCFLKTQKPTPMISNTKAELV